MARQENAPGKENADSSSSSTDVRGGIRFTAEQAGDTYSGEVGYSSGTAQEDYVTELPLEQDEDEDDDEGQQQSASHPSTLQRQMVCTSLFNYYFANPVRVCRFPHEMAVVFL